MSTSAPDDQPTVDPAEAEAVLRRLAATIAYLPQEAPPEGEELPEGEIALPVIEQDGTQYIAVFTSEESLQSVGADPATAVSLPLADLAANWPADHLWLAVDPSSENGVTIPPDVVRVLPGFVEGVPDTEQ